MAEQSSSSGKNIIIGILTLLLLASIGGNIFQYLHTKQVVVEKEKTLLVVDSLTIRKNRLEAEYNASISQLEQFKGENASMDSLLQEAYAKIETQRKKIAHLIDENQDYQILQQKFDELKKTTEFYLKEIERLQAENKQLKYENTQLSVALDQTKTENTDLKGKVDVASKLKINGLGLTAVSVSGSNKEKETDKAKKTERLKINFSIDENPLAATGPHTVYFRITNPDGYILADAGQSVKKFKTEKGDEIPYSKSLSINYDGGKLTKGIAWEQDVFGAGTYKIEIYIDGYYAGGDKINLY